jgi:hypothetical protein
VVELAGLGLAVYGVWLVFPPAALIIGGAVLVFLAFGLDPVESNNDERAD